MLKTRKRWISLLLTLAMLVAFAVPFAGTAYAASASYNQVTTVPVFDSDGPNADATNTATIQVKFDPPLASWSFATMEVQDSKGKQLTINSIRIYPSAKIATGGVYIDVDPNDTTEGAYVDASALEEKTAPINIGEKSFFIGMKPLNSTDAAKLQFDLNIDAADCADGDVKVHFFNPQVDNEGYETGGQFVDGTVVAATAGGGAATLALVGDPPILSEDTADAQEVTFRLNVLTDGALKGDGHSVKIKLPAGFAWSDADPDDQDGRVLYIDAADYPESGVYDIKTGIEISDSDKAKFGDVVASVTGEDSTNVSPSTVTVATYVEYGVDISIASVKTLLSGKYDQKTDKITIEEKAPGSLLEGRKITVKFPDWVNIEDIDDGLDWNSYIDISVSNEPDGTSNKVDISIDSASENDTGEIEFKANLSIAAGQAGDLVATVSGAGISESKVTVAKVVCPVAAANTASNVKIGVQDQVAPDITLTEATAAAFAYNFNIWDGEATNPSDSVGKIALVLPEGARFDGTPTATVTSGDLEIDEDGCKVVDSYVPDYYYDNGDQVADDAVDVGTDRVFEIPIDSESVTASVIKISGIKLTLDRTVPEGPLNVDVKGTAVVENNGDEDYQFNAGTAASFALATCVTPAPNEQNTVLIFTIGTASYTQNGTSVPIDVAPYIKDGRTFLPLRFAANAFGVSDSNVVWDDVNKKATIILGDRVIQFTIGSNLLTINGAVITMDVAPEILSGRVMVPIRYLGQALGGTFTYDATANTVTATY